MAQASDGSRAMSEVWPCRSPVPWEISRTDSAISSSFEGVLTVSSLRFAGGARRERWVSAHGSCGR